MSRGIGEPGNATESFLIEDVNVVLMKALTEQPDGSAVYATLLSISSHRVAVEASGW